MGGREVKVRGEGCLVFNSTLMALEAAVAGYGLAYLLKNREQACLCLADRQLVLILADLCPPFSECQLHHLNRQQAASAFALLVDALRSRG
jgi:DNA-binding transcriptional LysR family regulator